MPTASIRVSDELKSRLDTLAQESESTLSGVIVEALNSITASAVRTIPRRRRPTPSTTRIALSCATPSCFSRTARTWTRTNASPMPRTPRSWRRASRASITTYSLRCAQRFPVHVATSSSTSSTCSVCSGRHTTSSPTVKRQKSGNAISRFAASTTATTRRQPCPVTSSTCSPTTATPSSPYRSPASLTTATLTTATSTSIAGCCTASTSCGASTSSASTCSASTRSNRSCPPPHNSSY